MERVDLAFHHVARSVYYTQEARELLNETMLWVGCLGLGLLKMEIAT